MTTETTVTERHIKATDGGITRLGSWVATYALVLIFLWFGFMKFTDYEVSGVAPLIGNNPLISWLHVAFGLEGGARFLGVYEILTGVLIALRPVSPRASGVGGAMAVISFLFTFTLMFTTPGVAEPLAGGFPALSAMPGQFLLKDVGLLALSLWVLGISRDEVAARAR